jgi:probable blue pigment (indigoidine) exporter
MLNAVGVHRFQLSLVVAAACWGGATVISKRAVEEIEPLTLLPLELTVSVVVLGLAMAMRRGRVGWSPEMRRLSALGVLNPGLAYALSLAGLARVDASVSVLLWALEPVLILGVAFVVLRDRVPRPVAWSAGAALAGVVLVVFQPGHASAPGIALTIAGVAACAVYTVLSSRCLVEATTVSVVFVQQVTALLFALVLLIGSLVLSDPASLAGVSATAWLSAVAAGALYYGVAFWFYLAGLRGVTASVAGVFINLVPVFGITASYIALGERLSGRQWIGAIVVIGAVGAAALLVGRGAAVEHEANPLRPDSSILTAEAVTSETQARTATAST